MTDDQLDVLVRAAMARLYDYQRAHPAAAALIVGVAQRTDLRLTRWTHETDEEWSAAMVGACDARDHDGTDRERPRLFLTVAPTPTRWRATVEAAAPVPGGDVPVLAEAIEDTIGKAMSRAEVLAWTSVHRDPALAATGEPA